MAMSLRWNIDVLLRIHDFESRTGLPASAPLHELEEKGGRYLSSGKMDASGKPFVEYVVFDPSKKGEEMIIYKRKGDNFVIHLETNTKERY